MEHTTNARTSSAPRSGAGRRRAAAAPAYYLQRPAAVWLAALEGRAPAGRRAAASRRNDVAA